MTTSTRPALDGPTAVPATVLLFGYNGLVIGTWAASLAGLRERLGLDSTGIAILLVITGLCAITGMQIGGRLSDAHGARRVCLAAVPFLVVGIAVVGLTPAYTLLLLAGVRPGWATDSSTSR